MLGTPDSAGLTHIENAVHRHALTKTLFVSPPNSKPVPLWLADIRLVTQCVDGSGVSSLTLCLFNPTGYVNPLGLFHPDD